MVCRGRRRCPVPLENHGPIGSQSANRLAGADRCRNEGGLQTLPDRVGSFAIVEATIGTRGLCARRTGNRGKVAACAKRRIVADLIMRRLALTSNPGEGPMSSA